jgi:hypothetical protein
VLEFIYLTSSKILIYGAFPVDRYSTCLYGELDHELRLGEGNGWEAMLNQNVWFRGPGENDIVHAMKQCIEVLESDK